MKRRTVHVVGSVGDATETGFGALGVMLLIWMLTEWGHKKVRG